MKVKELKELVSTMDDDVVIHIVTEHDGFERLVELSKLKLKFAKYCEPITATVVTQRLDNKE